MTTYDDWKAANPDDDYEHTCVDCSVPCTSRYRMGADDYYCASCIEDYRPEED